MSDNKIFAMIQNRSAAMTYLLQRAFWVLNVRRMLHENKKMEVIK